MTDDPQSFGPQRDRRRRKRILTKRNVLITIGAVIALFIAISIYFEMTAPESGGFGRLYSQRTRPPELPERQPYTVIEEQELRDQTVADPMLIDGMRREQFLGVEPGMLEKKYGLRTDSGDPRFPETGTADPLLGRNSSTETSQVRITGGPEGVRIEQKEP